VLARIFVAQKKLSDAEDQIAISRKIALSDKSIALMLEAVAANADGAGHNQPSVGGRFGKLLAEAGRLHLPGMQLQIRLDAATAKIAAGDKPDVPSLRQLQKDALRMGYLLIARKAANLAKSLQ
jgi:hypothetical protein